MNLQEKTLEEIQAIAKDADNIGVIEQCLEEVEQRLTTPDLSYGEAERLVTVKMFVLGQEKRFC